MPAMAGYESDVVGQPNTPKHHYIRSEREECCGCSLRDCPKRGSDRCGRPWPATLNWARYAGTHRAGRRPAGRARERARLHGRRRACCRVGTDPVRPVHRQHIGVLAAIVLVALAVGLAVALGSTGGTPEGWHLCSCRFDGHLTTCAANVAGHRDRQRSDCNPGARHLRWGCDSHQA